MSTIAVPVSTACTAYSAGARNMNVNSIGSVTPVRNEVSAIDSSRPPTARAPLGSRRAVHREARARQAEHHDREKAAHEAARGRIAREEPLQVSRHAVVVAQQEPRDVVQDVVQARHDQQAIQHAVDEETRAARVDDRVAHHVHAMLDHRPAVAKGGREQQSREAARDRHEAPAAEEREVVRQLDVAVAVVERAGDQSRQDADRHAQLRDFARFPARRCELARCARKSATASGGTASSTSAPLVVTT